MQTTEYGQERADQRVSPATSGRRVVAFAKVKAPVKPEPHPFGEWLKHRMDELGLDGVTLSRLTGPVDPINSGTISNLRNGKQPGFDALNKLADPLRTPLGELLALGGLASRERIGMVARPLPQILETVMDRLDDPRMTPRQQRALLKHLNESIPPLIEVFDEAVAIAEEMMRDRAKRRS